MTGPFKVLEKLSDEDHKIKEMYGKKPPSVVHFDIIIDCNCGIDPSTNLQDRLPRNKVMESQFWRIRLRTFLK